MTRKNYLSSPEMNGKAIVTEIQDSPQPIIRLNQTWLHAQGGGQKPDQGTINRIPVTHVAHNNGEVDHYVAEIDGFTVGQEVEVVVDAEWRRLNGRYHSAGHLIAVLTEERFPGVKAVGGHHWPGEARVEFVGDNLPAPDAVKEALPQVLDKAIQAKLPIRICGDPMTNRSIAIGDYPPIPCGGTHPDNTSALEKVEITQVRTQKGKLRVSYRL